MKKIIISMAACGVLALGAAACGDDDDNGGSSNAGSSSSGDLSGNIKIDGSSTVAPFAQAAAEDFQGENPGVKITVGTSGTGGGFEKFCAGETDISDASRPIKDDEEVPVCKKAGIGYKEIQVANDGIAVVTNPDLKVDCLTNGRSSRSSGTRAPRSRASARSTRSCPTHELSLFGPGTDSGTFDFFTDEINGEEGVSREDYQPSEDDNVLVQGVAGESGGLGYFGHSYYEQNKDKLNLVKVDGGDGCIEPTTETIQSGEYKPLSRPLFMYPSTKALKRPEVKAFLEYIIDNYQAIADASQIVAMSPDQASKAQAEVKADTGS